MRGYVAVVLVLIAVCCWSLPVYAESQIVDGVKKIIPAPIEIPKNIVENADEHGPAAIITGTVEGTAEGVGQIGDGTEDVVTAPVNEDYTGDTETETEAD